MNAVFYFKLPHLSDEAVRALRVLMLLGCFAFLFMAEQPAHAAATDGITIMIENIRTWMTGTFAKSIAVIAVVVVGFFFLTGRASLGLLITVIVGIFIVFSAGWFVDTITNGAVTTSAT